MTKEPLVTIASITAAATAIISALVAFGINLDQAQTEAIMGLVAVVAPLIVAVAARSKVLPVGSVSAADPIETPAASSGE